jgi:hypothetical protein
VNIFNVFYLPEFLNWAREFGMSVYLNNLHEPKYYNISSIPYTAKVKIQKKLEDYSGQNLNSVINFMMNSNTQSQFMTFESHIKRMDIVRQESFAATFPELALLYKGVTV